MNVGPLLSLIHDREQALGEEYRTIAERHAAEHDVYHQCHTFSEQCARHAEKIALFAEQYSGEGSWDDLVRTQRPTTDGLALLRDLRALYLAAEDVSITWVMAGQAAQALRDAELLAAVRDCHAETELQVKWLTTRIKVGSPQALVVG